MNTSSEVSSSGGIVGDDLAIFLEASDIVEDRCRNSQTMDIEAFNAIPRFDKEEIQIGKVLGKGGFCTVSEVKQVLLLNEPIAKPSKRPSEGRDEHDDDDDLPGGFANYVVQDRKYMATRYLRHGKDARYAVKTLSPETILHPDKHLAGIVDLAIEAKFLSCIRHPNIIKMRAMTNSGPFESGFFFLVLDRLYDILPERLKKWSSRRKSLKGVGKILDLSRSKKKKLKLERLLVCMDLSSALAYLHSHNIVYRDLKPDNIGFDVRGDVKLFDFGLSFEITEECSSLDGLYELSGNTGSMRYMAPEVALGNAYNHKVDVYSYGILFWQVMALQTPFEGHSVTVHRNEVILGSKRPPLEGSVWTQNLSRMTTCCWSAEIQARPEFADILSVIRDEASRLEEENVGDSQSTVFDRSRHTERSL